METELTRFQDIAALENLARMPRRKILLGATPITAIAAPLQIHQSPTLQIPLTTKNKLYLKRDDWTPGFGNKTRKLELILADALAKGADCLITAGGPQSNHCRQTAQFGRELGLGVHLMIGTSSGKQDFSFVGNQVVDKLFGAEIHVCVKRNRAGAMEELATALKAQGKKPYIIPVGGSDYLGTLAYALAFQEILEQIKSLPESVERIITASSSGGTHAGLVVGSKLAGWRGKIIGISIDQVPDAEEPDPIFKYVRHMVNISNHALETIRSRVKVTDADFILDYGYLQDGYGVVGDYDRMGVRTLGNHGIIGGPVYSSRAFAALVDRMAKKDIPDDGKTLFIHTGGAGEIDLYRDDIFV